MNPVYVVLKKRKEHGIFLPNFDSYLQIPEMEEKWKLLTLEAGECINVAKFFLSDDLTYIKVSQYLVSNINGMLQEELTDSYTLPRYGI